MTEAAVRRTYRAFLERMTDEMLDVVAEEFGGGLLGRAARAGGKRVLRGIEEEMRRQGQVVVAAAAARADGTTDLSEYEREFLRTNPVYTRYDGDRETALERDLLDHFERVTTDLAPLVASSSEDFWDALSGAYTRDEADALVDRHFSQAETFTEYRDGVFPSRRLGDRVIRVVEKGERRFRRHLREELDEAYGSV